MNKPMILLSASIGVSDLSLGLRHLTRGNLTPDVLKCLVSYDEKSGLFTFLPRGREYFATKYSHTLFNNKFAGQPAFRCDNGQGYRIQDFHGVRIKAHRAAWAICHGEWPTGQIDHINGIRDDNRIENLRHVNSLENGRNKGLGSRNVSGVNGVHWSKQAKKWAAEICVMGKKKHIGLFSDFVAACEARKSAEAEIGFHQNHGSIRRICS